MGRLHCKIDSWCVKTPKKSCRSRGESHEMIPCWGLVMSPPPGAVWGLDSAVANQSCKQSLIHKLFIVWVGASVAASSFCGAGSSERDSGASQWQRGRPERREPMTGERGLRCSAVTRRAGRSGRASGRVHERGLKVHESAEQETEEGTREGESGRQSDRRSNRERESASLGSYPLENHPDAQVSHVSLNEALLGIMCACLI